MRPLLQPGNSVTAVWRARLDEHLGYYAIEGTRLRAATLLASSHAAYGVTHLASLVRLLPERDPHEDIYEMLDRTLDDFDDVGGAAAHLIRFELAMLTELGFGLDLANCAATGATARPDLRLAEIRRRGVAARPASPGATGCCGCRRFCAKATAAPNGWSDQDLQDGFRADRAVPAAPRAGAARAGPFRCARRVHQCGDAASGANQFGGLTGLSGRPCERRDPYAAAHRWPWPSRFCHKHLWLWVPAFAGATDAAIRVLPDSAEKFNPSPWEND